MCNMHAMFRWPEYIHALYKHFEHNMPWCALDALQITNLSLTFLLDITSPVITLVDSAYLTVEAGVAVFADPGCKAYDSYDGDLTSAIHVISSIPTIITLGSFNVTYVVHDAAGNSASVYRTVLFEDTTAPVLTLLGLPELFVKFNATYSDPGCKAVDAFEGNISSRIVVTGSVNTSEAPGTSVLIQYDVSDSSGNSAKSLFRNVTIVSNDASSASSSSIIAAIVGIAIGMTLILIIIMLIIRKRQNFILI